MNLNLLMVLTFGTLMAIIVSSVNNIPNITSGETRDTLHELKVMITEMKEKLEECEKDLPKSQECVIVFDTEIVNVEEQ